MTGTKTDGRKLAETLPLTRVLLRAPGTVVRGQMDIAQQWLELGYLSQPDLGAANTEHADLVAAIQATGAEVIFADDNFSLSLDAVYVRDSILPLPSGLLLARMGKDARMHEPESLAKQFEKLSLPIAGAIESPGTLEGGDCVWIDPTTLLIGRTWRTNQPGIDQVRALVGPDIAVIAFDMPNYKGPGDVFHLMSVLSPISDRIVAGYLPLMPVALVTFLQSRNMAIVPVPDAEFETMGCNILALGNDHVVMLKGNPETAKALTAKGVIVNEIQGNHICHPGQGGPTCLTLPLLRGGSGSRPE
jgi:N-dimethylarginine dimethylaminohydrolase